MRRAYFRNMIISDLPKDTEEILGVLVLQYFNNSIKISFLFVFFTSGNTKF